MYMGAIVAVPTQGLFPIIYLGTGEADSSADSFGGTGVYKSTDGGSTWTLLTGSGGSNPLVGLAVSQIVVDPKDSGLIYVATSDVVNNGATGPPSAPTVKDPITSKTDFLVGNNDNVGVWRYNGAWFNLTNVLSANRSNDTTIVNSALLSSSGGPGTAPHTAGP